MRRAPGSAVLVALVAIVAVGALARVGAAAGAGEEPEPGGAVARWSEVFADEADTVVFLTRTALIRAPFGLAGAETLWTAPGVERLVRVSASPDRRHLAWVSRASDRDVSTLWLWDAEGVRRRAGYMPLVPSDIEIARTSAGQPSLDDRDPTGGRFATLGAMTRSNCADAMTWAWTCDGLWFGYRDGIAYARTDTARVRVVSPAFALDLHGLDPAPMLFAEVMRLGEGRDAEMLEQWRDYGREGSGMRDFTEDPYAPGSGGRRRVVPQPGTYLLYPTTDRLRAFRADELHRDDPWTADETTVWWVDRGKRLMTLPAQNPRATLAAEDKEPIVWLEWLPARRALARATGRTLIERGTDGAERVRLATGSAIGAVLAVREDPVRAVVTRDSLLMWDTRTDTVRGLALDGAAPQRMMLAAGGVRVFVTGAEGRDALRLDRLDPDAPTLVSLHAPAVKHGAVTLSPSGRRVLLFEATERGARMIEVCEVSRPAWRRVDVPAGSLGWEQVSPR